MNNIIPFRGRVSAATPHACGAVILAFQAKGPAIVTGASFKGLDVSFQSGRMEKRPDAIRGGLLASWHLNPDTGRLECRWSLSGAGEETDASQPLCSKCAGIAGTR